MSINKKYFILFCFLFFKKIEMEISIDKNNKVIDIQIKNESRSSKWK